MRRLLNTLYITTPGAYVCRDGQTVLVRVEDDIRLRVPVHTLASIVCMGQVMCSPSLLGMCAEQGVCVSFLSDTGRFLSRVEGPVSGNVLLRRAQYRAADSQETCGEIVRTIVAAKIANCRTVLLRAARESQSPAAVADTTAAAEHLGALLKTLQWQKSPDILRGIEGDGARCYFSVFNHLILMQNEGFCFIKRSRRPPLDNVNALLSFIYTLLTHDMRGALEGVGLDPSVGFLHTDRPGRPSLALDLIEEFRPVLADRLVLSLINRGQIKARGFQRAETGAVAMDEDTRKEVLVAYQKRKQEEVQHPFLEEKTPIGMLPHVQALLMARFLRGDLDAYPPYLWK